MGSWDKHCSLCSAHGSVLSSDEAISASMTFICCTEKEAYGRHLASILSKTGDPTEAALGTHDLD